MSKEIDPAAKRNLIILGGVIGGAILISFIIMSSGSNTPPASQSYVPEGGAALTENKGPKPQGYDKLAMQEEDERAKQAASMNESYLPTLTVDPNAEIDRANQKPSQRADDLAQPILDQPDAPSQPQQTQDQIRVANQIEEGRQAMIVNKKMAAFNSLAETWRYEPSVKGQEVLPATNNLPAQATPPAVATSSMSDGKIVQQAGDSLYASIDMSINTDEPSVVFATILSGKLRGGMLFGAARLNPNETITIEFDKLSMPRMKQMPFRGVVIDSATGRAALSGTVNRKIFSRYIMPIVASVAATYGDLLAKQGQTSTVVAGGMVTNSVMTSQQIRDAAAATGIKTVTGAIAENAKNSNPSVELPNKLSVEVKLMQDVILQ